MHRPLLGAMHRKEVASPTVVVASETGDRLKLPRINRAGVGQQFLARVDPDDFADDQIRRDGA
jgi:hypothetical protein